MLKQLEQQIKFIIQVFTGKLEQGKRIAAVKAEYLLQIILDKLRISLAVCKEQGAALERQAQLCAAEAGAAMKAKAQDAAAEAQACAHKAEGKIQDYAEKSAAAVKCCARSAEVRAKNQVRAAEVRVKARMQAAVTAAKNYAHSKAAVFKAHLEEAAAVAKSCGQRAADAVKSYALSAAERVQNKYRTWKRMWRCNQHFTFWLIPADGQHIAKTHVKKSHLKYAMTGVAAFLVTVSVTIGVLAHFAIQNEAQKQELAEYKATKQAQEKTIQELRKMAENNQKQLAYLSKLEDKVRQEMEKNGTQLPPKSDISAYAGKGGPTLGDSTPMGYMLEQEKNIHNEAKAKKADLENIINALENENYRREMTPSQWPTSGGYISSAFGGRANPFDGYSRDWHPGIDIAIDYGAPVYASASGYVQQAGWYGGYGRYVRLSHDFGYVTAYGHMSSIEVSAGQYVKKGEIIGYVGSSGYSTGPHLHFEVIRYGEQINPSRLM